jgi:hypothetical protein
MRLNFAVAALGLLGARSVRCPTAEAPARLNCDRALEVQVQEQAAEVCHRTARVAALEAGLRPFADGCKLFSDTCQALPTPGRSARRLSGTRGSPTATCAAPSPPCKLPSRRSLPSLVPPHHKGQGDRSAHHQSKPDIVHFARRRQKIHCPVPEARRPAQACTRQIKRAVAHVPLAGVSLNEG